MQERISISPDTKPLKERVLSGNIFIFHAFDVGDDINLEQIEMLRSVHTIPLLMPRYFKNYHKPLAIELPYPNESPRCVSCKIHNFGAISLTYKIPFEDTLFNVRKQFNDINNEYLEQSVIDVKTVFRRIKKQISKSQFFHMRSSYLVIQLDTHPDLNVIQLQEQFGGLIASTLRFETEALSEYQKNDILEQAIGYYRGDLIIIDTDAAFIYDPQYEETFNFFEFANIQQLELRYFDRVLSDQLDKIYEGKGKRLPLAAYLPFIGSLTTDPVGGLGKLKVDISVITQRLESSIKLAGEPYFSELYQVLVERLDLKRWQNDINHKLDIIHDVRSVYQHRIDSNREDTLTVLIIILISVELLVALFK